MVVAPPGQPSQGGVLGRERGLSGDEVLALALRWL